MYTEITVGNCRSLECSSWELCDRVLLDEGGFINLGRKQKLIQQGKHQAEVYSRYLSDEGHIRCNMSFEIYMHNEIFKGRNLHDTE